MIEGRKPFPRSYAEVAETPPKHWRLSANLMARVDHDAPQVWVKCGHAEHREQLVAQQFLIAVEDQCHVAFPPSAAQSAYESISKSGDPRANRRSPARRNCRPSVLQECSDNARKQPRLWATLPLLANMKWASITAVRSIESWMPAQQVRAETRSDAWRS